MIHVNWMVYGDNNLITYEDKPLSERFLNPILPIDFKCGYDFPENCHIKSIIRGGIDVKWGATPHTPTNMIKCCDVLGNKVNSSSPFVFEFKHEMAHI